MQTTTMKCIEFTRTHLIHFLANEQTQRLSFLVRWNCRHLWLRCSCRFPVVRTLVLSRSCCSESRQLHDNLGHDFCSDSRLLQLHRFKGLHLELAMYLGLHGQLIVDCLYPAALCLTHLRSAVLRPVLPIKGISRRSFRISRILTIRTRTVCDGTRCAMSARFCLVCLPLQQEGGGAWQSSLPSGSQTS